LAIEKKLKTRIMFMRYYIDVSLFGDEINNVIKLLYLNKRDEDSKNKNKFG
jgi:hypothetical protein